MDGLEALKKRYGFSKGNYKYIPAGGEIFKYIGQPVYYLSFKKNEEKGGWDITPETVLLIGLSDFDPMTMTYLCKYKSFSDKNSEEKEIRIIPEGFSWGLPEETGEMHRFMPMSLHYIMQEDEMFLDRVKDLYETRDTIPLESLKTLSDSKEQEKTLKYTHNIGAAIKTIDGFYLWVRLHKVGLNHRNGEYYNLSFGDERNRWTLVIKSTDKEYKIDNIGTVKLIDLM